MDCLMDIAPYVQIGPHAINGTIYIYPLPGQTYHIKHSAATPRLRNADMLVYGVLFLT